MSYGSTAYASFVRIHLESGQPNHPSWSGLPHLGRLAWEAAAQAVAHEVLPASLNPEPPEDPEEVVAKSHEEQPSDAMCATASESSQ